MEDLQKKQGLGWALKAGKSLVSQGKEGKKIFLMREQSGQKWAWRKAKEWPVMRKYRCQKDRTEISLTQGNKAGWLSGWNQSMKGLKCQPEKLGPTVGPLANDDVY